MPEPSVHLVHVFTAGAHGGNPAPIVLDADGMDNEAMRRVAAAHGHESGFVLRATGAADLRLRFWMPTQEVEMCGHATVGAIWVLNQQGRLRQERLRIETGSGVVDAIVSRSGGEDVEVEVSQPAATVEEVIGSDLRAEIIAVLGIPAGMLAEPIQNARTSRTKTLIPVRSGQVLDAITPDFSRVQELCDRLSSTGLYPYALTATPDVVDARQFPRSSGYPEDAATGVAAAALAFGLRARGHPLPTRAPLRVRQGRSMGRPSEIRVRFEDDGSSLRCWLGGAVRMGDPS
ncbi:phenazine biosynthesis protein PhzF family [Sphingomonas guangdongensis]|uniref:Phenazine biosynthesis protein PhzF family n=1 Tax=Sphingomonas guangdongensis TaxID=1141890 RepID=A0A285QYS8_9SPHN|nr:PhzF family phenazine biosynthesis protein [Sphingomonas guangdongensis]SOB87125.1 phenazine biosynthesis protein PhzF family [Sphingomonas guangdongensis]